MSINMICKMLLDGLTVAKRGGHGLIAAVWESPITSTVWTSRMGALVLLALPCADADDPVHQLALSLLLLKVVVLGNAVDELADFVGLARERGVGGALGQLVDLV